MVPSSKYQNDALHNYCYYSLLKDLRLNTVFQEQPIVCKLSDLGKSRSDFAQTCMITGRERERERDRQTDRQTDRQIWALLMKLFLVIIPNRAHPFQLNVNESNKYSTCYIC